MAKKLGYLGYIASFAILVSGCATNTAPQTYTVSGSFDDFFYSIEGKLINGPYSKKSKELTVQRTIYAQRAFHDWCNSRGGNAVFGVPELYGQITMRMGRYAPKAINGVSCKGLNTYAISFDGYLSFYREDEIAELSEPMKAAPAKTAEQVERDKEAMRYKQEQQRQCIDAELAKIRTDLKIGMHTNNGLVVDIRKPLALIQYTPATVWDKATSLEWVEINQLSPPYGVCRF